MYHWESRIFARGVTLLSASVFRLNASTCESHCGMRARFRINAERRSLFAGIRDSNRFDAVTPSRRGFSTSSVAILPRWDLPEPKYPEIQTPTSDVVPRNDS